jgi:16S rRNA (uracil1498-N3)-methyltransferase
VNARFYAPDAEGGGQLLALSEEEGQHLTRVLRLKEGAPIRLFDGRGREFEAVVDRVSRNKVLVSVGPQQPPTAPEPRVAVTLIQAVLKGDKMDDVVRDAVMMGVSAIQPTVTARSEVKLSTLARGNRKERWEKIAVASAKQCGRATIPEILEPCDFTRIPPALGELALPGPMMIFVEPSATIMAVSVHDVEREPPSQALVMIGPEGGWTPEEIELTSMICLPVTLGARTVRADAMTVVALSALFTVWREF